MSVQITFLIVLIVASSCVVARCERGAVFLDMSEVYQPFDEPLVKYAEAMQPHAVNDGAASSVANGAASSHDSMTAENSTGNPMVGASGDDEQTATANLAAAQASDESCCFPRIWASAEYAHWWTKGTAVPALVTTSEQSTPQGQAGRLDLPTTSTIFGDEKISEASRSGARLSLGGWIRPWNLVGFDLTFLILGNDDTRFVAGEEFEILGRPFFNVLNDEQDAKLINFPNLVRGEIDTNITTKFYTGEALLRKGRQRSRSSEADWYFGYRIAELDDDIRISENTTVLSGPIAGAEFTLSDQFRTRNTFHGVNFGWRYSEWIRQCVSVELMGKFAVGTTRTRTDIVGATLAASGGGTSSSNVGLLGQSTNIGSFVDDEFSTISEIGVRTRREFRPGLSLTLGYSFFYWQDVGRAGEQIDLLINTSQIPPGTLNGDERPRVGDDDSSFWAHGFRVGLEYLF